MLKNLSEKGLLLVLVLIIAFSAIIISWLLGGYGLSTVITITTIIIIALTGNAWISSDSNYKIRRFTLSIVSVAAIANASIGYEIIRTLVAEYIDLPSSELSVLMMLFLVSIVIIVFYFTQEKSNFANTNQPISKLIEGPTIKQKWESVCRGLESQIRDIDRDTNWSNEYYTPLEAEVEMRTSNGTKKVVKDLLEAIKGSKDRLFLMIGDPGAGKSVALRKLCLDILKDSVRKEYIPIYVNLKEWVSISDWHKIPPKWQDLEAFVKESLLNKDRHLGDFFEKYYDVLDENGNLFFVLDSFDEIPQVLGTTVESKLIEDLTKVCREFLVGAKQPRSRGILASREYRMPRAEYLEANTTLRVRPFSEAKIETTLLQNGKVQKEIVERLFKERRDLIPILRNPFISSLLQSYLVNNKNQLPLNQSELYADYINQSIEQTQKRLNFTYIPKALVLEFAMQAAKLIFSESGLQAPTGLLKSNIKIEHFDEIISVLRYTRIARGNIIGADMFSFTHRRFYEYFVTCDLLTQENIDLPLETIPTDSRWRDTLVLFCEVAPFKQAQKIANYCWDVINKANNISERNSKHCLRFLTEAFKGRQDCLNGFYDNLASFILVQIHSKNDPIDMKIALEALGILNSSDIDKGSIKAFKIGDPWINDVALRSCRHLDQISPMLENSVEELFNFHDNIAWYTGFRRMKFNMNLKELAFSLKLSEAFKHFQQLLLYYKYEKIIKIPLTISLFILLLYVSTNLKMPFISAFLGVGFSFVYTFFLKNIESLFLDKKMYELNITKNLLIAPLIIGSISGLFWLINKFNAFKEIHKWFVYLIAVMVLLIFFTFCLIVLKSGYIKVKDFFQGRKKFSNIDFHKTNDRLYISEVFLSLLLNSDYYMNKFLLHLENNVKEVSGAFPKNFLIAGKHPHLTRLIQLEERWREAEEREIASKQ